MLLQGISLIYETIIFKGILVIEYQFCDEYTYPVYSNDIEKVFNEKDKCSVYVGYDPTADCLHVGHLLTIFTLSHLQKAGLRPVVLVGGATGMIGDPSGRSDERPLLSEESVQNNINAISKILNNLLHDVKFVNNYHWYKDMTAIQFLRDLGRNFRMGTMLSKDTIKSRLDGDGLSFTEFSYQILQAYDFNYLFEKENCKIQLGGSDQWGNITAGIDLIRRLQEKEAYGITVPLLTTAQGVKIGKSMGNAVWLSAEKDPPFDLYQFFIRLHDADVEPMLKKFTFIPLNEIDEIVKAHEKSPEKREGQRILAEEVTRFVHGEKGLKNAIITSNILYGEQSISSFEDSSEVIDAMTQSKRIEILEKSSVIGNSIVNLAVQVGLVPSKKEMKRIIDSGGLYINDKQCKENVTLENGMLINDELLVLRSGKKNIKVITVK